MISGQEVFNRFFCYRFAVGWTFAYTMSNEFILVLKAKKNNNKSSMRCRRHRHLNSALVVFLVDKKSTVTMEALRLQCVLH